MPVPGKGDGFFHTDFMENRANMRHGPVDLRWDEERQVWAGGLQFLEGILTKEVKPAKDDNNNGITPDLTGRMKVRRKTAINVGMRESGDWCSNRVGMVRDGRRNRHNEPRSFSIC